MILATLFLIVQLAAVVVLLAILDSSAKSAKRERAYKAARGRVNWKESLGLFPDENNLNVRGVDGDTHSRGSSPAKAAVSLAGAQGECKNPAASEVLNTSQPVQFRPHVHSSLAPNAALDAEKTDGDLACSQNRSQLIERNGFVTWEVTTPLAKISQTAPKPSKSNPTSIPDRLGDGAAS